MSKTTYLRVNSDLTFENPKDLLNFIISSAKCKEALEHFPLSHKDIMTVLEYLSDSGKLDFAGMGALFDLYKENMERVSMLNEFLDDLNEDLEKIAEEIVKRKVVH